jgi:hypothetical protein
MTWRRDLSIRSAAEIATRHLPDDDYRLSVIDRLRKKFTADKERYLRDGKVNVIIQLLVKAKRGTLITLELPEWKLVGPTEQPLVALELPAWKRVARAAGSTGGPMVTLELPDDEALEVTFQKLRSALRAVYTPSDEGAVIVFQGVGEIQSK